LISGDGGSSWSPAATFFKSEVRDLMDLRSVQFVTEKKGYAVGELGTRMMVTEDGGASWSYRPLPDTEWLRAVWANSEGKVVVAGEREKVLTSGDQGATWTTLRGELPKADILGGETQRLVVLTPSQAIVGEPFWVLVKAEDSWGNPSHFYTGTVTFSDSCSSTVTIGADCSLTRGTWTHGNNSTAESYRINVSVGGDFTVNITAEGLYNISNECWDAKLDVPGRVFDPSAGEAGEWMSSFYYVEQAICPPGQEVALRLRPSSISAVVEGMVKLRQGNTVIEMPFTIEQDCPQPLGWEWVLLAGAAFIVFFGYLLVWWFRQK